MPRFTFSAADEDGVLLRSCQIDAPSVEAATNMFVEQAYHGISRWSDLFEDDREYGEPAVEANADLMDPAEYAHSSAARADAWAEEQAERAEEARQNTVVMSAPQPTEGVRWSKPRVDIRTRCKYHFLFKKHSGNGRWYEWNFIGPVLELRDDPISGKKVYINFRPDAGTSEVAWDDIIAAFPVSYDMANRLPRRVAGGASGVSA